MKKIFTLIVATIVAMPLFSQQFKFAYLSDTHIAEGAASIEDLQACINDINKNDELSFVVITGDITEFGADKEIELAKSIIDGLNKPYYVIAGNHDAKWSESGCNTFVKVFGYEEFEFDCQGIKFIGTNSGPNMRMAPALLPRESMVWLDSIANTIDKKQPVVFINHYPMDSSMLNYTNVLDELKKVNTQLIMGGHWHTNRAMVYEGIPGVIGRSTMKAGRPGAGYNIVEFNGSTVSLPLATGQSMWYRASVSGTSRVELKLEYSTDGGQTWNVGTSTTDEGGAFAQGATQYVWGLDAQRNNFLIDDITFEGITYDEDVIGTGIYSVEDATGEVVREEYFDLSGRRIVPGSATRGVVIRRSYLSNGSVRVDKLLMR